MLYNCGLEQLVEEPTGASGEVFCTTIHSFKGLESPVVILAEIDNDQIWNLIFLLYFQCQLFICGRGVDIYWMCGRYCKMLFSTDVTGEL